MLWVKMLGVMALEDKLANKEDSHTLEEIRVKIMTLWRESE